MLNPLKISSDGDAPEFVSLGMTILDEIQFPSRETVYDALGGSGVYSTSGARMSVGTGRSHTIGCLLLVGNDFPAGKTDQLNEWNMNLIIRSYTERQSTRGLLVYEDDDFGRKTFQYTTTPLQPLPGHIQDTALLRSAAFHFLAGPADILNQIDSLLDLRSQANLPHRPLLVWEPAPLSCRSEARAAHLHACKKVDVFSPNHLELVRLFDDDPAETASFDRGKIETYAQLALNASVEDWPHRDAVVVVRAGEHGCMAVSKSVPRRWFPPFHQPDSLKIVDTTGAGNAFLGAFTVTFQDTNDLVEAVAQGSVAASFAVEQISVPRLDHGMETWNGDSFQSRLEDYRARLS